MNINMAVKLSSRAWCVPILSHMHAGIPGRKAQLIAACQAPRNSFSQSLQHLFDLAVIERTPGHGHPFRPEFRLSEDGIKIAAQAHEIWSQTQPQHRALLQKSWVMPLLLCAQTPRTNKALKDALTPITDRALSLILRSLEDAGLLDRNVDPKARPPRPIYAATIQYSLVDP